MKISERHSKPPFVAYRFAKSSALRDLVHYSKQIDAQAVAWLAGPAENHRLENLDNLENSRPRSLCHDSGTKSVPFKLLTIQTIAKSQRSGDLGCGEGDTHVYHRTLLVASLHYEPPTVGTTPKHSKARVPSIERPSLVFQRRRIGPRPVPARIQEDRFYLMAFLCYRFLGQYTC